jgi:hypothetical protein
VVLQLALKTKRHRLLAVLVIGSSLTACGGGGAGSGSMPADSSNTGVISGTLAPVPDSGGLPATTGGTVPAAVPTGDPSAPEAPSTTTSGGDTTGPGTTTTSTTNTTSTASTAPATSGTTQTIAGTVPTVTASNSARLVWLPPAHYTDGTAITSLAGYRVFYGQELGKMTSTINIGASPTPSVTITNLALGTWYFTVKAISSAGIESDIAAIVSKTIR